MISKPPTEAFVWIYLPGRTVPVVAGRLYEDGGRLSFNYGRSYLKRDDAIPIYAPELPLRTGGQTPAPGLSMPACLRDAAPDAWGRRVILNRKLGLKGKDVDVEKLDELTYALESGSDRIGALDFQASPEVYIPRQPEAASLEELLEAAERVEQGIPITPELEQALFHGSALGGARPKALIDHDHARLIAKFSSAEAGLRVAPVRLAISAGSDVLLVERFDRVRQGEGWTRRAMVSALTLFGLDEMMGRYTSYEDLATIVRVRFEQPLAALRELFGRVVFNVLCGNTDDHARNHAAFWDGRKLELTPAYDICPQGRAGNEASQAMLIAGQDRMSRLEVCLRAAGAFLLDRVQAEAIIAGQIETIRARWTAISDEAALSEVDRRLFWRRQFLNPYAFEGAPERIANLAPADGTGPDP
jgi:serine/threonine-protein kinase HipA